MNHKIQTLDERTLTDVNTGDNFKREISQTLAIKLNKTRQHANEKMLIEMVKSGGKCSALKQAVQARSAVYDE